VELRSVAGLYPERIIASRLLPEDRIRKLISAHIINFGIACHTFTEPAQSRRLKGIGGVVIGGDYQDLELRAAWMERISRLHH